MSPVPEVAPNTPKLSRESYGSAVNYLLSPQMKQVYLNMLEGKKNYAGQYYTTAPKSLTQK
jgi:hypothetical protein